MVKSKEKERQTLFPKKAQPLDLRSRDLKPTITLKMDKKKLTKN